MVATPSPEIAEAIGRLLRADPARTLAVAQSLRGPGRSVESTVTGMSMGPGLGPGSRIRIALMHRARYEAGEVVAYLAGNQVVVHRVAHRGRAAAASGYVVTRGDATLVPDPPVERGRILGPVTGVWRSGGWVPPAGPPPRSPAAKLARTLSLATAIGALYVSPRVTASALTALHRAAGALRVALARSRRRRSPRPPEPS
jgi:hypothetical protein